MEGWFTYEYKCTYVDTNCTVIDWGIAHTELRSTEESYSVWKSTREKCTVWRSTQESFTVLKGQSKNIIPH